MTSDSQDARLPEEIQGRQIVLRWDRERDPLELRRREWLITNGLGGYASGTIAGIPTRKYHGLFVPNLAAPKGRHIMISRCDESVITPTRQSYLGGAEFEDERVVGESHLYLKEFRLDHRIAVWTFELEDTWMANLIDKKERMVKALGRGMSNAEMLGQIQLAIKKGEM